MRLVILAGLMALCAASGHTYPVCVGAIYPYDIQDQSTAPCIDIKLQ